MVNKVILVGRAGIKPEIRYPNQNNSMGVANFTLATSERFRDKSGLIQERTEWHNIVCWGKNAEIAEKFILPGTQLYIEGKLRHRSYDAKDGGKRYVTEIFVDSLVLLGRKGETQQGTQQGMQQNMQQGAQQGMQTPQNQQFAQPQQPQQNSGYPENQVDDIDLSGTDTDDLPF